MYFLFGLLLRTFEVTVITVVKFLITCLAPVIVKDKEGQRTSAILDIIKKQEAISKYAQCQT